MPPWRTGTCPSAASEADAILLIEHMLSPREHRGERGVDVMQELSGTRGTGQRAEPAVDDSRVHVQFRRDPRAGQAPGVVEVLVEERVDVPDADAIATLILAALDGISLGLQLEPDSVSLDQMFADLRRATSILVAIRLNPALMQFVDHPPDQLELLGQHRHDKEHDDERSNDTDR